MAIQAQKVLNRLALQFTANGGWVENYKLNQICYRYSARIFELRKKGIDIQKRRECKGVYSYRLATPPSRIDFRTCRLAEPEA